MMKRVFITLLFVTFGYGLSFGQYIFDIKGKNIEYARGFEKSAGGALVTDSMNYISAAGVGDPLVYVRRESGLPNLKVYYFPNSQDSTLNYVLYEWDASNFNKDHQATKQPLSKLQPYIDKFNAAEKLAIAAFGQPENTGTTDNPALIEMGRFRKKDIFKKDGVEVELYIVLSNKQEVNGIVSILPTHRVRMYVKTAGSMQ